METAAMATTSCDPGLRQRLMGEMLDLTTIGAKAGVMAVHWVNLTVS